MFQKKYTLFPDFFRFGILSTFVEATWSDERERFVCNTREIGKFDKKTDVLCCNFCFRLTVLTAMIERIWYDEQKEFVCNTKEVGKLE